MLTVTRRYRQAPMFSGSSCTHMISAPLYFSSWAINCIVGQGNNCSILTMATSILFDFFCSCSKSKYIFPVQNSTRLTFLGSAKSSPMISWNLPFVNSDMGEITSGCLSNDFGAMTTQGFLKFHASCRRNK